MPTTCLSIPALPAIVTPTHPPTHPPPKLAPLSPERDPLVRFRHHLRTICMYIYTLHPFLSHYHAQRAPILAPQRAPTQPLRLVRRRARPLLGAHPVLAPPQIQQGRIGPHAAVIKGLPLVPRQRGLAPVVSVVVMRVFLLLQLGGHVCRVVMCDRSVSRQSNQPAARAAAETKQAPQSPQTISPISDAPPPLPAAAAEAISAATRRSHGCSRACCGEMRFLGSRTSILETRSYLLCVVVLFWFGERVGI